ncbi:MAG: nuclear transport factor 2 family protein [Burkholderiales bacterium]|nr:nuclear transport factor 2 family protein [Burkholderiales bacterium]
MTAAALDALVRFYETLEPRSVEQMGRFYAIDCHFKDPFNEVSGLADIQEIFRRMYRQLDEPRFKVSRRMIADDGSGVVLVWEFEFRIRAWRPDEPRRIHGISLLGFNTAGRVNYHRDYWDAAEELYEKLPLVGWLMRGLKRCMG